MLARLGFAPAGAKLTERGGRSLKLVAGFVMIALAMVTIVRPRWLR